MRRAAAEEGERESLMGEEVRRLTAGLTELALMAALLTGFSPVGVASADALEPHTVFFVPVQIGGAGLNRLSMGWACTSEPPRAGRGGGGMLELAGSRAVWVHRTITSAATGAAGAMAQGVLGACR